VVEVQLATLSKTAKFEMNIGIRYPDDDDDDDVYLDKLQTRGVKKSILRQCET
jgi:hypothetical protein